MSSERNEKGLTVNKNVFLKDACDAVHYCTMDCASKTLGCAVDCLIRKHFGIPPHGSKWPVCTA